MYWCSTTLQVTLTCRFRGASLLLDMLHSPLLGRNSEIKQLVLPLHFIVSLLLLRSEKEAALTKMLVVLQFVWQH